ncbi:chromate resistance protein ChrB domain-containing protein [Chitinophaga sp. NPDC101104]|uniref:chromate resistance protein ChrB domain-containing protein n=1 Tax=Chitinophaga sp. NPDC101104 TaxID=3390561 RepID=UPI003D04FB3B
MNWITRERPKIDRIACPWLIRRFVDQDAVFFYVPADQVIAQAAELGAIPFDVAGVEFTHYGDECTFDYIIRKYQISDEAVLAMAPIVRGADTDRHDFAPQASGLWAISAGLAYNHTDDHDLLEKGMLIYDALYSWAKHLQKVKHTQQPDEQQLLIAINRFLQSRERTSGKMPAWAKELKEMIQDHIDTSLTLKELSQSLDINPSYLSRKFSKHFDNLSFAEYIQQQRIGKAIQLMKNPDHTLTEIAYLTGFSDQSHFTRIFRKLKGESPNNFRKNLPE